LRLFEFYSVEIRGCDLERVEDKAGGLAFEPLLQDHLHDLVDDALNGVRVLKNGEFDFSGRVLFRVVVTVDKHATIVLMVETELLVAKSGRTALCSADFDVVATRCC